MVVPGLAISSLWFDEHLVELEVAASNGRFVGRASLYESHGALASLASALHGFPAAASDSREVVLGNFDSSCGGGGVRLRFRCVDAVGHTLVDVTIRADPRLSGESATFSVRIEPSAVDAFVQQLSTMPLKSGRATLAGMA